MKPAFRDRPDAGRRLAGMLERYKASDALVLAIPAGGVPVAGEIAKALGLELRIAPVSKVLLPWTTESGFGAVAFDGGVWIDQSAVQNFGLTPAQIETATRDARAKVERRTKRFGGAIAPLAGKTAIVVDDGVAAGSTMRTAIAAFRRLHAKSVVVAVPTGHARSIEALRNLADDVVCANIRGGPSFAVADAYEEWRDLSDDEVEEMLKR